MNEQEKIQRIDLLEYQVNEIKKANLEKNEEDDLKKQREIYQNAEQIVNAVSDSYNNIYGGDEIQSAYDGLSIAVESLSQIKELDIKINEMYEVLSSAMYSVEDAAHELKNYGDSIEYDEQTLNDIEDRLDLISKLKRKYGSTVEDILMYMKKAESELNDIRLSDEKLMN